jgi:hypothetical protein
MDAAGNQVQYRTMISRSVNRQSKSVHNGGDSMKRSENNNRSRNLMSAAILFGAMFTMLLVPAFGQQEVDPTWYDPSPAQVTSAHQSQAVAAPQPAQLLVADRGSQQTAVSVSSAASPASSNAKRAHLNQRQRNAASKNVGTPAGENRLPATDQKQVAASVPSL